MDIEESVDKLHERTQQTRLDFSRHEAVCQERYEQLLKNLEEMSSCIKDMRVEINELRTMASNGKVSLRTLLWVGSLATTVAGLGIAALSYFK